MALIGPVGWSELMLILFILAVGIGSARFLIHRVTENQRNIVGVIFLIFGVTLALFGINRLMMGVH